MTEKEAKEVLDIIKGADNGCRHCVRDLFVSFIVSFPMFAGIAEDIYVQEFDEDLYAGDEEVPF